MIFRGREYDLSKVESIEVDGIDTSDYPDFSDAFISYAEYDGGIMTDEELEWLNTQYDFVYQCVMDRVF